MKKADFDKFAEGGRGKPYGIRLSGCQSLTLAAVKSRFMTIVRQEYGQHPQKWQESADFIDQKMLVWSATIPNTAAPRPPMPKAKPKRGRKPYRYVPAEAPAHRPDG